MGRAWIRSRLGESQLEKSPKLSRMLLKCLIKGGKSSCTVCHITDTSTPKYSWISLSLVPAMSRQGISEYVLRKSNGIFLIASPITSIARTTA